MYICIHMYICIYNMYIIYVFIICIYVFIICVYVYMYLIICIYVLYIRMYIWYETSSWNQHDTRKPFEELKCKPLKPLESNCRNRTTQLRRLGDVRLSALVQPRPCTWSAHKSWALMKVPPGRKRAALRQASQKASKSHKYAFQWQSMQGVRWFCAFLQSHLFLASLASNSACRAACWARSTSALPAHHQRSDQKAYDRKEVLNVCNPIIVHFKSEAATKLFSNLEHLKARLVAIRLEFVFVRK